MRLARWWKPLLLTGIVPGDGVFEVVVIGNHTLGIIAKN
jgi:hypothetical protein